MPYDEAPPPYELVEAREVRHPKIHNAFCVVSLLAGILDIVLDVLMTVYISQEEWNSNTKYSIIIGYSVGALTILHAILIRVAVTKNSNIVFVILLCTVFLIIVLISSVLIVLYNAYNVKSGSKIYHVSMNILFVFFVIEFQIFLLNIFLIGGEVWKRRHEFDRNDEFGDNFSMLNRDGDIGNYLPRKKVHFSFCSFFVLSGIIDIVLDALMTHYVTADVTNTSSEYSMVVAYVIGAVTIVNIILIILAVKINSRNFLAVSLIGDVLSVVLIVSSFVTLYNVYDIKSVNKIYNISMNVSFFFFIAQFIVTCLYTFFVIGELWVSRNKQQFERNEPENDHHDAGENNTNIQAGGQPQQEIEGEDFYRGENEVEADNPPCYDQIMEPTVILNNAFNNHEMNTSIFENVEALPRYEETSGQPDPGIKNIIDSLSERSKTKNDPPLRLLNNSSEQSHAESSDCHITSGQSETTSSVKNPFINNTNDKMYSAE